jgi:hypothetical protein
MMSQNCSSFNPQNTSNDVAIITDSNLIVWFVLADFTKGIKNCRSLGRIVVHPTALNELKKWQRPGALKRKRFGSIVDDFVDVAEQLVTTEFDFLDIESVGSTMEALRQQFNRLSEEGKVKLSDPPSPQDLRQLSCAVLFDCKIATQERSLTAITKAVDANMHIGFLEIVMALLDEDLINEQKLLDGLQNLDIFKETVSVSDRNLLIKHAQKTT